MDKLKYCGTIAMAARRLGIFGRMQEDYFVWFDPTTGTRWKTEPALDKQDIFFNACQSLNQYLAPWNPQKTT